MYTLELLICSQFNKIIVLSLPLSLSPFSLSLLSFPLPHLRFSFARFIPIVTWSFIIKIITIVIVLRMYKGNTFLINYDAVIRAQCSTSKPSIIRDKSHPSMLHLDFPLPVKGPPNLTPPTPGTSKPASIDRKAGIMRLSPKFNVPENRPKIHWLTGPHPCKVIRLLLATKITHPHVDFWIPWFDMI
jgi:hypothetical protein